MTKGAYANSDSLGMKMETFSVPYAVLETENVQIMEEEAAKLT